MLWVNIIEEHDNILGMFYCFVKFLIDKHKDIYTKWNKFKNMWTSKLRKSWGVGGLISIL
jgi:hypothetical protein